MPIKEDWVYILSNYRGYLAPIKQFGPIVHPAKVKKSEAIALMMAGCPVVVYDPQTKNSYPLTFENSNMPAKEALHKIPKPIEPTVLKGAPKGAGDLGISEKEKPIEPKLKVDLAATIEKIEEAKTSEEAKEDIPVMTTGQLIIDKDEPVPESVTVSASTNDNTVTVSTNTKTPLSVLLANNELTEDQVVWSDYTKGERRQIRAHLNQIAAAASAETTTEEN